MLKLRKNYKNFRRMKNILTVITRYGLGHVFDQSGLLKYFKLRKGFFYKKEKEQKVSSLTPPERVRLVCEELGPTFIKMGQILSTRPDLVPQDFLKELNKLQDEVPPFSFEEAKKQVQKELGKPLEKLFLEFDKEPLAAASLSQVHKAKLKTGELVAVKIQRPGIEPLIDSDISILKDLASFVERKFISTQLYQPVEIVEEFKRSIKQELDFINEGRNIDAFRNNFKEKADVRIPKVYWKLSSSKVLTMEYITGEKLSFLLKQEEGWERIKPKVIAQRSSKIFLKQIFEDGLFHADPHPGNIFIEEDGTIALLDFGMIGRLDSNTLDSLIDILMGIVKNNSERIVSTLEEMEATDISKDSKKLKRDIQDLINKYYGLPLKQIRMNKLIPEILEIITKHKIKIPTDLALLAKALITTEGTIKKLDPEFNIIDQAKPFAQELLEKKYSPQILWRKGHEKVRELFHLLEVLPKDILWFLRAIKKGKVDVGFEHKGLEKLINEIDRASNRLSLSLIIAALIIGSSLVLMQGAPPFILGYPAIGIIGFLLASFLGLGLIISILRSGKWK